MRVVAIVGMPGSGKSILSTHMKTLGFPVIRFGGIIIDEVKGRGLEITPRNEQIVREELRERLGMDACAQIAMPQIKSEMSNHQLVVIDGLYSYSEYSTLKQEFGSGLIVVAVFTPKRLRYRRLSLRLDRPLTEEEAERRDYLEIERLEKGGPIALADFTLVNDGTSEKLIQQMEIVLNSDFKEIEEIEDQVDPQFPKGSPS